MKPRDLSGNDFVVPCAALAIMLFVARHDHLADPKDAQEDAAVRTLTDDLYGVIMKHWKAWE